MKIQISCSVYVKDNKMLFNNKRPNFFVLFRLSGQGLITARLKGTKQVTILIKFIFNFILQFISSGAFKSGKLNGFHQEP